MQGISDVDSVLKVCHMFMVLHGVYHLLCRWSIRSLAPLPPYNFST